MNATSLTSKQAFSTWKILQTHHLGEAHVPATVLRLYGFDRILLPQVSKLTRSVPNIDSQVPIECRSSEIKLRHVRIFANDEGIYLAPCWKGVVPLENATWDFLIDVLNSSGLYKKERP
jgi:hypothetical protein